MPACSRRGTSCVLTWLWFHGCLVIGMYARAHENSCVYVCRCVYVCGCVGLRVLHKTEAAWRVTMSAEVYNIIVHSSTTSGAAVVEVVAVVQQKIFFVVAICQHPSFLGKSLSSSHAPVNFALGPAYRNTLLISTIMISRCSRLSPAHRTIWREHKSRPRKKKNYTFQYCSEYWWKTEDTLKTAE